MLFRIIELYQQGRDLRNDPVGFGVDVGRDALAPMFVLPVVLLGLGAVVMMGLWWWVGWGIFIFVAFVAWIGILFVHIMHVGASKLFGSAEAGLKTRVSEFQRGESVSITETTVIDVEARE